MPAQTPHSVPDTLCLRPEIAELPALVDYIDDFAAAHGLQSADASAFTLAAEELFANTVTHCHPPATSVEFALTADAQTASATYSDDGPAFDPTHAPPADTTLPLDQRPIGGLGIHFIRKTMQTFAYERAGGRNVIRFGRPRSPNP